MVAPVVVEDDPFLVNAPQGRARSGNVVARGQPPIPIPGPSSPRVVPDLEAALAAQSEAQRWLRKRAYTLIAGKRFLRKATDYLNAGLRAQEFKQIMLSTSIFALQIGLAFSGVPGLGGIVGSATGVSSAVGVQAAVTSASNVGVAVGISAASGTYSLTKSIAENALIIKDPTTDTAVASPDSEENELDTLLGQRVGQTKLEWVKETGLDYYTQVKKYPLKTFLKLVLSVSGLGEMYTLLKATGRFLEGDYEGWNKGKLLMIKASSQIIKKLDLIYSELAAKIALDASFGTTSLQWTSKALRSQKTGTVNSILAKFVDARTQFKERRKSWITKHELLVIDNMPQPALPDVRVGPVSPQQMKQDAPRRIQAEAERLAADLLLKDAREKEAKIRRDKLLKELGVDQD